MSRIALNVQDCCADCRRPVSRCPHASEGRPSTYPGILLRGTWTEVQATPVFPGERAAAAPPAAIAA